MSADTQGHCCWPSQAWSKSRNVCIGIPTCPSGMEARGETCERRACPVGQVMTEETRENCCWPGQVWSTSRNRCIGVPQSCPPGQTLVGEDCELPKECRTGEVRTAEGPCCWPGQAWVPSRRACVGVPTECPAGSNPQGEDCVSSGWATLPGSEGSAPPPPPAPAKSSDAPMTAPPLVDSGAAPPTPGPAGCPEGQVSSARTQGHCCWPGQIWSNARQTCAGPQRCPPGWTAKNETCLKPGGAPTTAVPPPPTPTPEVNRTAVPPPTVLPSEPASKPPTVERVAEPAQPPATPAGPKRTRTSLVAGLVLGDATGGALGLRIRIGLMTLMAERPTSGTLALLIEPWLWVGGHGERDVSWLQFALALNLGVGWQQRLGPVELTPRVGLYNGLSYRTLVGTSDASGWSLSYSAKVLLGLSFAVPAGEGKKFQLGVDAFVGDATLWLLHVGVTF